MQLLFLQQWFSDEVLKAIGWTLIHSLWQGLLAAVIAGVVIITTKRSMARLRYNLLGAVLILFVIIGQNRQSSLVEKSGRITDSNRKEIMKL